MSKKKKKRPEKATYYTGKKKAPKKNKFLEEYGDFVTGLASPKSMRDFESKIATGGLGMVSEGGEFADVVKKILFHEMEYNEEVRQRLIKELGDVMWYVAFTARNVLDISIKEIIEANIEKLSARYPSGKFSHKDFMRKEQKK